MIEVTGNLWNYKADATGITTNGVVRNGRAVMGAGCALEAAQRYPWLPSALGELLEKQGNRCEVFFCPDDRVIVAFPTKENYKKLSTKERIISSALECVNLVNLYGFNSIVIPRPGCGLGGLKWIEVKKWLDPIFDDRFHIITFG